MKIKILLFSFLTVIIFSLIVQAKAQEKEFTVRLFLFYSDSCPHCRAEEEFLKTLEKKYPQLEIDKYEVSNDFKNVNLFKKITGHYGLEGSVPLTIMTDEPIVGFDSEIGKIAGKIEEEIKYCAANGCNPYPVELFGMEILNEKNPDDKNTVDSTSVGNDVRVFGKNLNISQRSSLFFLGFVLGLADGINPCMFSVLLFMLTYLMSVGSTKKALKAGIAFSVSTFLVYFLFMIGIIQAVNILKIASQIRLVIISFALIAGLLMLKDFFFYGKWFSLEIPSNFKPKLEALTKKGTIPSVILLAILSSLVELPCTSGLPLAYISILASREVPALGYLLLYNFFFILPLILIVMGVVFAWSRVEDVEAWREKTRKYMRLVAGLILIFLAIALWKNWL